MFRRVTRSRGRLGRPIVFASILALGGCAPAPGPPPGPVVSPTGIVYEPGTPPAETRFSQTATLYLHSGRTERALELAMEGVESDPYNPVHYFLAGMANARLGRYVEADRMFSEAERIYPAYELDTEAEREPAWAEAFNAGADAYGAGDLEGAIEAWRDAALIFDLRPEAHRNLAMLLQEERRFEEAIEAYRDGIEGLSRNPATRVLEESELREREAARIGMEESLGQLFLVTNRYDEAEAFLRRRLEREPSSVEARSDLALALSGQGRSDEAGELYVSLLSEAELEETQLFNVGVALFRAQDFGRASEAFARVAELRPYSRDAWFNYANALFGDAQWASLAEVGDRLIELDPLNGNAALIVARAHLESGDEGTAVDRLDRIDDAPVHVEGLLMAASAEGTTVQGRVSGNRAEPGSPLRLRFIFYGDAGELGRETVGVRAPASGESVAFEVAFPGRAVGYRYELVP
jgi:tetratricopeptide (TPR) repeat protein